MANRCCRKADQEKHGTTDKWWNISECIHFGLYLPDDCDDCEERYMTTIMCSTLCVYVVGLYDIFYDIILYFVLSVMLSPDIADYNSCDNSSSSRGTLWGCGCLCGTTGR